MIRRAALCLLGLLALIWTIPAIAHSMPNSVVNVDVGSDSVRIETILPANELRLSFGASLHDRGNRLTPELREGLERYLAGHIALTSDDGRLWPLNHQTIWIEPGAGHDDVVARMTFVKTSGISPTKFTLHDDAITHIVMSHVITVFLRGDDRSRALDAAPEFLGMLQNPVFQLSFSRSNRVLGNRFAEAFKIGMRHILLGFDHLLFLLTLILPAPFLAAFGRWVTPRSRWGALGHLAAVVTAFTLGHSATLMMGVLLDWQLPWAMVEVTIALSVFVAAVQAWRPILGSREPIMAGVFGLVHGMAFSAVIGRQLLDPWVKFDAVLAFNLGVETVQLIVIACVAPLLIFLAPHRWYHRGRAFGSLVIGCIAAYWMIQRLAQSGDTAGPTDTMITFGYFAIPAIAATALVYAVSLGQRGRRRCER
jgi:energy-converting hydrogenase Eha subunit E